MASMIMSIMIVIWVTAMVVLKRLSGGANNAAHRNRPTGLQRPSETAGGRWLSEKIGGKTGKYRAPRSTDGHVLSREQDITCRQFGHNHPEWEEPAQECREGGQVGEGEERPGQRDEKYHVKMPEDGYPV